MIRVLHFAHEINYEDIVDSVLRRLDRARFEPRAIAGRTPQRPAPAGARGEYPVRTLGVDVQKRTNYPGLVAALVAEIWRFQPHVLHAHHFDEALVSAIAARIAGVPFYVIGRHYSDKLYQLASESKLPFFLAAENFANRTAARIVIPVDDIAPILRRQGIDGDRIVTQRHGFNFSRLEAADQDSCRRLREEYGLVGRRVILYCGRLVLTKGVDVLISAAGEVMRKRGDVMLVIAGSGPLEGELRDLADRCGTSDRVLFVGWTNDVVRWISAADLLVNPSSCESFSQVVVEGLAVGTPVIATPIGIAPEAIGRDERGLLVSPGDIESLARRIENVLDDPEQARVRAERARSWVREYLSIERTVAGYENLYRSLVGELGAGR